MPCLLGVSGDVRVAGMATKGPLDRLMVKEDALAEGHVAAALEQYVGLTSSGGIVLKGAFDDLKAREQVLCILLAMRAAQLLGLKGEAGLTPLEIVEVSGMAGGTVRPKLSELVKSRLVAKEGGRYEVPMHALLRATRPLMPVEVR